MKVYLVVLMLGADGAPKILDYSVMYSMTHCWSKLDDAPLGIRSSLRCTYDPNDLLRYTVATPAIDDAARLWGYKKR